MSKILVIYGTRPEQIKLKSTIEELKKLDIEVEEWWTGQSPDLVEGKSPVSWKHGMAGGMSDILLLKAPWQWTDNNKPDAILVAGDTASAFAGALAGFLSGVPVGHIEAGLRTYSKEPWPEEQFRRMIADIATWHFCPDEVSAKNVIVEITGLRLNVEIKHDQVFITGNPVIDTLEKPVFRVLVTMHRRENWGENTQIVLDQLSEISNLSYPTEICVIKHPNWSVQDLVEPEWNQLFFSHRGMDHDTFTKYMSKFDIVITDSGGLQEEAAFLGKTCLVVRNVTERAALLKNGAVTLIKPNQVKQALEQELAKRHAYGTGQAGAKIALILKTELEKNA